MRRFGQEKGYSNSPNDMGKPKVFAIMSPITIYYTTTP